MNNHPETNIDTQNIDTPSNSRVIWEFTFGIPYKLNEISVTNQKFKDAVFEITEEITKITDGLTYNYCYGTWKDKIIERDISVRISVIVLPEIEEQVYNSAKSIISEANKKYELGIVNVQAIKSIGFARHFFTRASAPRAPLIF